VRIRFEGVDGVDGPAGAEEIELDALNVVVANGRFAGGGLPIAPRARPDDGLLDVVVIPRLPLAGLVALAPLVLTGRHLNGTGDGVEDEEEDDARARTVFRRCRGVELESDPPMPWNTDGELIGELSPSFRVVAGALDVLVGEAPLWEREPEEVAEADAGPPVPWPSYPETA
jgi:diacylglycerol kinase (ATP)